MAMAQDMDKRPEHDPRDMQVCVFVARTPAQGKGHEADLATAPRGDLAPLTRTPLSHDNAHANDNARDLGDPGVLVAREQEQALLLRQAQMDAQQGADEGPFLGTGTDLDDGDFDGGFDGESEVDSELEARDAMDAHGAVAGASSDANEADANEADADFDDERTRTVLEIAQGRNRPVVRDDAAHAAHAAHGAVPRADGIGDAEREREADVEYVLLWRRERRRARRMVPRMSLVRGEGTPLRARRAHDSDMSIAFPRAVLLDALQDAGAMPNMHVEELETPTAVVRPWSVYDIRGFQWDLDQQRYKPPPAAEVETLAVRENDVTRNVFLRATRRMGLAQDVVDVAEWVQLQTLLGVLRERDGRSTVELYSVLVRERDMRGQAELNGLAREIAVLEHVDPALAARRMREHERRVLSSQPLVFLIPFVAGHVPEARPSARTFLLLEPFRGDAARAFPASEGYYLPATLTLYERFGGRTSARKQFVLGPRLTRDAVRAFLAREHDADAAEMGHGADAHDDDVDDDDVDRQTRILFPAADFRPAVLQTAYRRRLYEWMQDSVVYVAEGGSAAWREATLRALAHDGTQACVLVPMDAILVRETDVLAAEFRVQRSFHMARGELSSPPTPGAAQDLLLLCNSTGLVLKGQGYGPDDALDAVAQGISALRIYTFVVTSGVECIPRGSRVREEGGNGDGGEVRRVDVIELGVRHTTRHVGAGTRLYYGGPLRRLVVVDRSGRGRVREPTRAEMALVEDVVLVMDVGASTIVLGAEQRVILERTGRRRMTTGMLLAADVYLLSLVSGAYGRLTLAPGDGGRPERLHGPIVPAGGESTQAFVMRNYQLWTAPEAIRDPIADVDVGDPH